MGINFSIYTIWCLEYGLTSRSPGWKTAFWTGIYHLNENRFHYAYVKFVEAFENGESELSLGQDEKSRARLSLEVESNDPSISARRV